MDNNPPWGTFAPSGRARFAVKLAELGFGRGHGKRILSKLYLSGGAGKTLDIIKYGLKWRLDFSNNPTDYKAALASGYDKREINLLRAAGKNGVIVDIGANIGYYALQLAQAGAKVLALEPNPRALERLRFNIEINAMKNITVLPLGVGDEGEQTLSFGDLGSGTTLLFPGAPHTVQIRTSPLLDILTAQNIPKIDALKIDIEGAEDLALVPFFQNAPREMLPVCICMEDCHRNLWKTDIVKLILESGYRKILKTRANIVLRRAPG